MVTDSLIAESDENLLLQWRTIQCRSQPRNIWRGPIICSIGLNRQVGIVLRS